MPAANTSLSDTAILPDTDISFNTTAENTTKEMPFDTEEDKNLSEDEKSENN